MTKPVLSALGVLALSLSLSRADDMSAPASNAPTAASTPAPAETAPTPTPPAPPPAATAPAASPADTNAAAASEPAERPTTYTMVKGDSLDSIAHKFGTSIHALAKLNHIPHSKYRKLRAGTVLQIPPATK